MNDRNQERFLDRIQAALKRGGPARAPAVGSDRESQRAVLERIRQRTFSDHQMLLDRLTAAAEPLNLDVIRVGDASAAARWIAGLVREKAPEWGSEKQVVAWQHPLIDRLELSDALADQQVPVYTVGAVDPDRAERQREEIRSRVIDAYIGVTAADFCVVESATLVLKARPGQARSVSLVPSIHVAVIERHQLIENLTELYALLRHLPEHRSEGLTNAMTFISGPSKTADIEAMLVHGAHGPREVHICVIAK